MSLIFFKKKKTLLYTISLFCLKMYNFTSFAVSLNELETGMEAVLAPTDCRLRPDIRGMENGELGTCIC